MPFNDHVFIFRYGHFTPDEFYRDSTPGFRYWKKCTIGVVKFQKLWDRFWALQKIRRFNAAKLFQKVYRRYYAMKVWRPIIRLRMKMGKRTYFRFCWNLWLDYNRICKRVKDAINFYRSNCVGLCFTALKNWYLREKTRKENVLKTFRVRFLYFFVDKCLQALKSYAVHSKRVKQNGRRMMQNPHFASWVRYTKDRKLARKKAWAVGIIQGMALMRNAYRRYQQQKWAYRKILWLMEIYNNRLIVEKIRRQAIDDEFKIWKPEEMRRREAESKERERLRQNQRKNRTKDKIERAVLQLKKHLKSSDGRFQVSIEAKVTLHHSILLFLSRNIIFIAVSITITV